MTPLRAPYPPAEGRMSLWKRFCQWCSRTFSGRSEFLCDTCKYDYGSACTRPERPNARRCPDYRRK